MVMRNKTPVSATYHGYIASSRDALLVIDAVLRGLLLPVTNRPTPKERKALIRSGNVFVFIEEESNIKRWTDGTSWSPSRILGRFLIYRELSKNIVKDSNNNLSAITSVVEDNGDSNNMDNGNASGSRATSTATNNNNNSTNNNGANNHYASTESRFVKLNCQPITAYAMAGGEDVIRKRSIDDVIKEDANSNNNNNNNTDTNSTHNSIRGDTTISNTNEINTNLLNSNIEVDVLSDNIYRSDGLIKKSLSIVLHSPSRKTIHLVSYYTTKDVINDKLNIPSSDNFFKDNSVVPSYELIDSLLNTSLGHSISHRRRSDPSSGPISFLDTDGFDDQTVMSYTNHKRRRLSEQRQQQQQHQYHQQIQMQLPQQFYSSYSYPYQPQLIYANQLPPPPPHSLSNYRSMYGYQLPPARTSYDEHAVPSMPVLRSASHPGFDTLPLSHDFQQPQQTASVTQTHQYHQHHPQQQQQQQQLATAAPPLSQQLDYPTSLRTLPVSQSSQMQQNDQLQFNASPLVNETDDVSNQNKHPQSTLESSNLLTLV